MRTRFYLRGREAPIEFEAENVVTKQSTVTGELTAYTVEGMRDGTEKLAWASLADLVAITTQQEEGDAQEVSDG